METKKVTDKRIFEVILANGHVKYPVSDTLEDAIVIASADGLVELGEGKVASVKDDEGKVYTDIDIKVNYTFHTIK